MKLDSLDLDILRLLQTDGRMSFREIADKLEKPESTIRSRFNAMSEQDYFKIVALTNPDKLGFGTMALVALKVEPRALEEVARTLAEVKEVRFIAFMAGKYDLFIEIFTQSNETLMDFITGTVSKLDGVRECDINIELKLYKEAFNWLHHMNQD